MSREGEPAVVEGPGADAGADDVALVAAVAAGDRQALAALYDRHGDVVLGVIQRVVRDPALAEDLLHDVFLEAWHQASAYEPGRGSVRTWLLIRARSRALDRRSKQARDAALAVKAGREGPAVSRDRLETSDLDGARLRRAAAGLDAELSRVIELAYFEGLSSSEMAVVLDIPIGTVKSRVKRALATLRAAMSPTQESRP